MNKFDELLNKYFDNEITNEGLNELNEFLKDDSNLEKFRAIQLFESSFKVYEYNKAPAGFTDKLMNKLISTKEVKSKKSYFLLFVDTVFVLLLSYIFILLSTNINWNNGSNNFSVEIKGIIDHVLNKALYAKNILSNKSFVLISSFASLVILLVLFFIINSHKEFKKKIESFSKS